MVPLVLTNVVGLSTLQLGLFLIPGGAAISIVAVLTGRVYDRVGPRPLVIPAAVVWLAVLWFLSRVDEGTSVIALIIAWLVLTSAMAAMWTPLTTSAMGALRAELYSHGSAAFATVQRLAGAAFGAVFTSAYTIGSGARDAGVLSTAQAEPAGHAAFLTAWAIGLLVLVGACSRWWLPDRSVTRRSTARRPPTKRSGRQRSGDDGHKRSSWDPRQASLCCTFEQVPGSAPRNVPFAWRLLLTDRQDRGALPQEGAPGSGLGC